MGCGIAALAWSDYTLKNIVVDTTPEDCHQICLGNSSCLAFQTIDARDPNDPTNRYCRLYKQPIRSDNAGYNDPWPNDIFYDRDCPDHLPVSYPCGMENRTDRCSLDAQQRRP